MITPSLCRYLLLLVTMTASATLLDASLVSSTGLAFDEHLPSISLKNNTAEKPVAEKILVSLSSHNEKSRLRAIHGDSWRKAIADYRTGNMQAAADNFIKIWEEGENLSEQDRAAAAFWAYRSLLGCLDKQQADMYLALAAEHDTQGFYGMIARNIKGAEALPPKAQISMALEYLKEDTQSEASYFLPDWKPPAGYKVDPALIFAIMREESDFNPDAVSASGAVGVMQLMPDTAHAMARRIRLHGSISDPANSMALGQHYLERLMAVPDIGDNLVFLTASYNAGPALVKKWQESIECNDDPLVFIESIPYGTTRDYVINVLGNYWVYSGLLGGKQEFLNRIAVGKWPVYAGLPKQFASRLKPDNLE